MKRIIYFSLVTFLIILGCSKSDDFNVNPDENLLKSATAKSPEDSQSIASSVVESCELLSVVEKPTHGALLEGETMVHITFKSSEELVDAIVEITMPQIFEYRIGPGSNYDEASFTPNNRNKPTVITWVGDLASCPLVPKTFCIIVKPNCNASGKAVIWSDFKVNGVSKKGAIKNKVFYCN